MESPEYAVRPTEDSDAPAINALYQRVTQRVRSLEQWRTEWREGPYGPAPSWVIVERASGAVVGHHGLIEIPLRAGERVLRAARTENTMVAPEFRSAFYYPAIEVGLLNSYRARFDLLLTTTGAAAQGAMRKRFGYRSAGRWTTRTIFDTPAFRAARALGSAGTLATGWSGRLHCPRPAAGSALEDSVDFERVERLWQESTSGASIGPHRSAEYLRWRIARHPWNRIASALFTRGGRDQGFVAWRDKSPQGALRRIVVEDVFVRDDDEATYGELFALLAQRYRAQAARIKLRTIERDRPLQRAADAFARAWWKDLPEPDTTELLALGPAASPGASWEATTVIDEGV